LNANAEDLRETEMTSQTEPIRLKPIRLWRFVIGVMAIWSILLVLTTAWQYRSECSETVEMARNEARTTYEMDVLYRRWNAERGGVYAEVSESTQPNPYLKVAERDILSPSQRRLTLINPAYMMRQAHELASKTAGVRGHITSLNPIRPANAPDPWEAEALKAFQGGAVEQSSVEIMAGEPYIRLMRPLVTESGCLSCHAAQGYQLGDIRGGICVSMPLAPLLASHHRRLVSLFAIHGVIWLAGLVGVGLAGRLLNGQLQYRLQAEAKLRELAKLQGVIEMSGAVCHELNQPLQAISGYSELILLDLDNEHPLYGKICALKKQIGRMGGITAKLMNITHYESKAYSRGKIVDIDKASRPASSKVRLDHAL
jgi:hypothetical protein